MFGATPRSNNRCARWHSDFSLCYPRTELALALYLLSFDTLKSRSDRACFDDSVQQCGHVMLLDSCADGPNLAFERPCCMSIATVSCGGHSRVETLKNQQAIVQPSFFTINFNSMFLQGVSVQVKDFAFMCFTIFDR